MFIVAAVEPGEQAGDRRVFGVRCVELFDDGKGLGWLVLLLVKGGELSVEGGVVGIFGERGGQEGLGLVGLLLMQKEMSESGGGVVVLRVGLE